MKQRKLGQSGPMVSAIGLGCLSFGGTFGETTDAASLRCLDMAWDHGITLLDTANIYGMGRSETLIGTWLKTRRHAATLVTKAGFATDGTRRIDNSPKHLRVELEGSLRRLGIEHVALFYAHRHEFSRPIEEVAETMAGFVAEGKIGAYGLSEVSPGTLRRAHAVFPCAAVQNEYSLWTRQPELGLIQACAETGTSFVPFSPLSRGALGQEMIDPNSLQMDDFRRKIPRFIGKDWTLNQPLIAAFRDVARNFGHSVPELALAWILDQGPHLIPVPGTRSAEHLLDWVNASEISLTDDHRAAIAMTLPVGWAYGDRYNDEQAMTVARYC